MYLRLGKLLLLGGLSLLVLRWVTQRVATHDTNSVATQIGALGAVVLVGLVSGFGAASASVEVGRRLPAVSGTAVGGHPGLNWRAAAAVVVLIESVFVAGGALGAVGATMAAVPVSRRSAAVGGVLLTEPKKTGLLNYA
jgi:hypothetical protein